MFDDDHDHHEFEYWVILAPIGPGWIGFFVFVAWVALGCWLYLS